MLKGTLAVLIVILGNLSAMSAQIRQVPSDVSIRGKVFTSTGQAAERVEVRLERAEMQVIATAYTDGIGNFEFRNLAVGNYSVVVRMDGYEEVRQQVDMSLVRGSGATITVTLNRNMIAAGRSGTDDDVVDITELQRDYPRKAVQEYERAVEDHRKGNTEKAIQRMEEVVKLAPDFYQAHNNLGVFYQKMGRFADAAREYQVARTLNPRASEPLVNLGSLYIQESDARRDEGNIVTGRILDDALDILEEAVKMDSRSAIGFYYLGAAYYKSEFYPEAEQNLLRAQRLDPMSRPVRLMLVNVYMKMAKWLSVLAQLDAYLSENPKASDRAQMEQMRSKVLEGLQTLKK